MHKKIKGKDVYVCHDCSAVEGEYHVWGCDMERCPICLGQLISCDCGSMFLCNDTKLMWHKKTNKHYERIINIEEPVLCAICGKKYPMFFMLSDKEWEATVPKNLHDKVICKRCYNKIKRHMVNRDINKHKLNKKFWKEKEE